MLILSPLDSDTITLWQLKTYPWLFAHTSQPVTFQKE